MTVIGKEEQMGAVLELKDVSKKLGGSQIIDHLSFTVNEGEIFGFLGPNGAGKTTTINMIVGLLSADEGEILIDGVSIKDDFENAMKKIGGIIENPEMYDYMSGRKNLKIFGRMYGNIPKERYAEIIDQVKLNNRIDDKVKKYSLGMRQRLGVAQALLHKPKLLILDEPTNGLDPAGIKELRDNLREMAEKEHMAVMVSSHLLAEMELMCDRFGIIDKGVLMDTKTLTDIQDFSKRDLMVYTFDVDNFGAAQEIMRGYLGERADVSAIRAELTRDQAAELNAQMVRRGIKVYAMNRAVHSLEDEFLAATSNGDSQIR